MNYGTDVAYWCRKNAANLSLEQVWNVREQRRRKDTYGTVTGRER